MIMYKRENFTAYEILPEHLGIYMSHFGPHFNKKACDYAVSQMYKVDESGDEEDIVPITKKEVESILTAYNIKLKHNYLYDAVYVANMCKADYLGSSISSEEYMAKFIKDTIDDPDGAEGLIFNRWIADMKWLGIPIDWEELI